MARTKAFDPDLAVERAMQTFWERGFEATSTSDLLAALHVSRSSLYGTFDSKDELYRRALSRYAERSMLRGLAGDEPVRVRLRRALLGIVERNLDEDPAPRGCFAGNAAAERPQDPAVAQLAAAAFAAVRRELLDTLRAAVADGELATTVDPGSTADLLLVVVQGLHITCKATRDRALAESAVDAAIARL